MTETQMDILIRLQYQILATGMKTVDLLSKKMTRVTKVSRDVSSSFKKMNLQFMGAMFFGMNVSRTFQGLLNPALNAVGVFDIFGNMLTIFFLPAAMLLLDFTLALYDFMSKLPAPVQDFINVFVILAVIFGTAISLIGTLAIGLGGLIPIFGLIGVTLTASGVGLVLLGIIAVIALLYAAWKTNFGGIQEHLTAFMKDIGKIFGGFFDILISVGLVIKGIIDILTGKPADAVKDITAAWQKVTDGIGKIFTGAVGLWWAPIQGFIDMMAKVPIIGDLFTPLSSSYKNLTSFATPTGTQMYNPALPAPNLGNMPWNNQQTSQVYTMNVTFNGITDVNEITKKLDEQQTFFLNSTNRNTRVI